MFVDYAKIEVKAGRGGNGSLSFRREKYVEFGGPNGGNGGRGGDIILEAQINRSTLLDVAETRRFKAPDGGHGEGWNRAGRAGEDLVIAVPCGTVVKLDGKIIGDLHEDGQRLTIAAGGRGGRGNSSFKTHRTPTPKLAEKGEPGEEFDLELELKLIADVGLLGMPNAGKSTFLARVSEARPKIADYPFTTLVPNLGVARSGAAQIVIADIPGLIEGAHAGKGLGIQFLRHIERTRLLLNLIDPYGFGDLNPEQSVRMIEKELKLYSPALAKKPRLLVVTKLDTTGAREVLSRLKRKFKSRQVLGISSASGEGVDELLRQVRKALNAIPKEKLVPEEKPVESHEIVFAPEFTVEQIDEGWKVSGKKVERLVAMTNFDQDQGVRRFQNILKKMGVEKALAKAGAQPGDSIVIGEMGFNFEPSPYLDK